MVAFVVPKFLAVLSLAEAGGKDGAVKEVDDFSVQKKNHRGSTELGLLFPCCLQGAAKFVTCWSDAHIVFVKSNITLKSEDR